MKDLYKINIDTLYQLWRNFALSLLAVIFVLVLNKIFPTYLAPIFSTIAAAGLYFLVNSNTYSENQTCMLTPYVMFVCMISYTVVLLVVNLFNIWSDLNIPFIFVFFSEPFSPTLVMAPVSLVICTAMYLRRSHISICVDCRVKNGTPLQRGRTGMIYNTESAVQLLNLVKIFAILTALTWLYYSFLYIDEGLTKRDVYVFTWIVVIFMILDIVYFAMRYYNLYLDLKEREEVVSPQDMVDMTRKTYLRYYVFCDDSLYMSRHEHDPLRDDNHEILDTPFFTKRTVNGFSSTDVRNLIVDMTGVKDGELKFFFGRKSLAMTQNDILRYFYFIPGIPEDYPELKTEGIWMSCEKIKTMFSQSPYNFSTIFLADAKRLNTIIVTEKTYTSDGERKLLLKQYRPSFNFRELKNINLDFQDDKWIRVASFNSDVRFFKIKRWLRRLVNRSTDKALE